MVTGMHGQALVRGRSGARASERDTERGKEEEDGTDDRVGICWRTLQREDGGQE